MEENKQQSNISGAASTVQQKSVGHDCSEHLIIESINHKNGTVHGRCKKCLRRLSIIKRRVIAQADLWEGL